MPILDVEIVTRPGEEYSDTLAATLADRAAAILGSAPGGTWVKLHLLRRQHYAENDVDHDNGLAPVFVSVIRARLPEPERLRTEALSLAEAFAPLCRRPRENVHIIYEPEGRGRVAFGGVTIVD
jgi:phenylpyruvate tautomerase PptA (4-oxalocrotonate tautomerase family)